MGPSSHVPGVRNYALCPCSVAVENTATDAWLRTTHGCLSPSLGGSEAPSGFSALGSGGWRRRRWWGRFSPEPWRDGFRVPLGLQGSWQVQSSRPAMRSCCLSLFLRERPAPAREGLSSAELRTQLRPLRPPRCDHPSASPAHECVFLRPFVSQTPAFSPAGIRLWLSTVASESADQPYLTAQSW